MQESGTTAHAVNEFAPLLQTLIDHRAGLVKTAARITGCPSRAEDVVQDAFLRVSGMTLDTLPFNTQLNYVFRIVRNLAIDHYRKQSMEQKYFVNDENDLNSAPQLANPESINVDRQTLGKVDSALAQLPARTRYAFIMYRVYGEQQKDIAAELGVSPTLVNFMIRDALVHCKNSVVQAQGR
ncbi:RNA polymerase factor sigma-70 [Pseudomonas typographi]|uniref:RNA polymerase factor sigma-70 n=1 Tax=Pseudomonas typographi TaxID=2715964 RepID=A0ABR7Z756_9PSED|nr:RNA polymerase factor sigma-70 [Pseudomonas typographi]MBD1554510.1 RNA polymerase factor sigma-70 [Pseudomonas typographi]MBD1589559.1 RNA polymerase factor sigma-70 [Pseudomonas typographi]MBD1601376.1 RNA polymerase factor sigma-70 [Pseudomonas typographi]